MTKVLGFIATLMVVGGIAMAQPGSTEGSITPEQAMVEQGVKTVGVEFEGSSTTAECTYIITSHKNDIVRTNTVFCTDGDENLGPYNYVFRNGEWKVLVIPGEGNILGTP